MIGINVATSCNKQTTNVLESTKKVFTNMMDAIPPNLGQQQQQQQNNNNDVYVGPTFHRNEIVLFPPCVLVMFFSGMNRNDRDEKSIPTCLEMGWDRLCQLILYHRY
jgi:hypothetical protein